MAANAGQPFNQEGCVMTLEELSNNLTYWFSDGLDKLIEGTFLQLTIGQAVFTVFFVTVCVPYMGFILWQAFKDLFMD